MQQEDEEEDIKSYWMTVRKREVSWKLKRKHYISLLGELALEYATILS
jgi:hypothetical protein